MAFARKPLSVKKFTHRPSDFNVYDVIASAKEVGGSNPPSRCNILSVTCLYEDVRMSSHPQKVFPIEILYDE